MTLGQNSNNFGVNFFGSMGTKDGIGRAARLNTEALSAANIPLNLFHLTRPVALEEPTSDNQSQITNALLDRASYNINICHFSSRWTGAYWDKVSAQKRSLFYNIGYWVCEVPELPESWAQNLDLYDEIWTASAFCQNAIARVSTVPVLTFQHPIEPVIQDSFESDTCTKTLRFLFISNCYSDAERKNALGTLRAFHVAFRDREDVSLTLKLSNLEYAPILEKALRKELSGMTNVTLEVGYRPDVDIDALYRSHHVYVSLHRAEGYGLTLTDALRYGMPVVCTGYSGNMEFSCMPGVNLVEYDLVPIGHERLRYLAEQTWANPRLNSAVAALRKVAEDFETQKIAARESAAILADRFSIQRIGEMMQRRLNLVHRGFAYHDDMSGREIDRDFDIYEA